MHTVDPVSDESRSRIWRCRTCQPSSRKAQKPRPLPLNHLSYVNETESQSQLKHSEENTVLVFIDDVTGRLMHLRFGETEPAFDYIIVGPVQIDGLKIYLLQ